MNYRIFTFLIFLFGANISIAQQHICGVTQEDQKGMIKFIEHLNKNPHLKTRSVDPIYVPIKFHITSLNDGTGGVKASKVLDQMSVLIDAYKELGIYLYIQDAEPNYISSTSIYLNPGTFVNTIINNKDNDAVDVFICQNAQTDNGVGTVLGFYSPFGDYVVMRNQDINGATASLAHELGHLFDLPHTFQGWENVHAFYGWTAWNAAQFNGMWNSPYIYGSNTILAEVMNQSNCDIAGDRICDTPPDYNFGFGISGCAWNQTLNDVNGDLIDPMENNIMGYFIGCDDYVFTQGQVDVMVANYNSSARDHLDRDYVPDTTVVTPNHELTVPASAEKLEYYTDIQLSWTEAEGASNYLVSIDSGTGDFYEFFTTETQIVIEELLPNTFYFWNVKAFNEGYTSAPDKSSFFTTGTEINTSIKESELIQNVNVFPNPSSVGQAINVSLSMEETTSVSMSVIDITGKLIQTNTQNLDQGINNLRIDANLDSGVYILKLDTNEGSIHKKIVVQ
ncbi:MAG: T9SS type A sorting domain-containing protein [Saprospiraceae bacterium]|nr:T9SS type A sorting domain-containing protein [Saprospiraceae bacterium]